MRQTLAQTAVLVREYDEAIDFYISSLGFRLVEDVLLEAESSSSAAKRWVVVCPDGASESRLLLARAEGESQLNRVGDQTGGRVFLFLHTDDFWRDYRTYKDKGVEFVEPEPRVEAYGTVIVFKDLYGNQWDLIQPSSVTAK